MCSERLTMNLIQTLVNLVTTVVVLEIVWDGIQKPTGLIKVSTADLFVAAELKAVDTSPADMCSKTA